MLNYQNELKFSFTHSKKRIKKANRVLGSRIVLRILAFALYLLGANRKTMAQFLNMPLDTIKSLIKRTLEQGLPALEDRRQKSSEFLPPSPIPLGKPRLIVKKDTLVILLNDNTQRMELSRQNKIQCRTVLLTMLSSGLLTQEEVAYALDLSSHRIRKLKTNLLKHDVHALMDQRKGQQHDFRVTSEIKAELIQQYILNLNTEASTSSQRLRDDLQERCQLDLAARTIRLHIDKLGLRQIRESLPRLLTGLKKTRKPDSDC